MNRNLKYFTWSLAGSAMLSGCFSINDGPSLNGGVYEKIGREQTNLLPLTATSISDTEISLNWSDITGADLVLALITGSAAPTSCSGGAAIANVSPYAVTGLSAGTTYTFVLCQSGKIITVGATASTRGQNAPYAPIASIGGSGSDTFGFAVAISGDKALIGNPLHERNAFEAGNGEVEAYTLSSGVWRHSQTIIGSSLAAGSEDGFGYAIDMKGNEAVIGANRRVNVASGESAGAAFYFKYNVANKKWQEKAILTATSIDAAGNAGYDFGASVSVENGVIAVGSPNYDTTDVNGLTIDGYIGSVYLYTGSDATWQQAKQLIASDSNDNDKFGQSVALSGSELFVGAPQGTLNNVDVGSVYIYKESDDWTTAVEVGAPIDGLGASFGARLVAKNDTLVVADAGYDSEQGRVYVFRKDADVWQLVQQIAQPVVSEDPILHLFGAGLAMDEGKLLIGSPANNDGQGGAHLYESVGIADYDKVNTFEVNPVNPNGADYMGTAVAISGKVSLLGSDFLHSGYMTPGDGRAIFVKEDYLESTPPKPASQGKKR